jgi:hypothetical protein
MHGFHYSGSFFLLNEPTVGTARGERGCGVVKMSHMPIVEAWRLFGTPFSTNVILSRIYKRHHSLFFSV